MASLARSSLLIGPGKVRTQSQAPGPVWDHTFMMKSAAVLPIEYERATIATEAHGPLDYRILDIIGKLSVTPDGAWTSAARAALWPYANTRPGTSLGIGPPALTLGCFNGEIYSAKCGVLTKMPDLFLGARETIIGDAEYTLIRDDNKNWTEADSLIALTSGAYVDPALTIASIKTQPYTGALIGVTGFTTIESEEGWTVGFDLGVALKGSDSYGTLDIFFQSLTATVSCVPVNVSAANILALFQTSANLVRGKSIQSIGGLFKLTGADAIDIITFPNAMVVKGGFVYGSNRYRQDAITIVATRTLSSGAPVALFTLA